MKKGFSGILEMAEDKSMQTNQNVNISQSNNMPRIEYLRDKSKFLHTGDRQGISMYLERASVIVHVNNPPIYEISGKYYHIRYGESLACSTITNYIKYNETAQEAWILDNNQWRQLNVIGNSMVAIGNRSVANELFSIVYGKNFFKTDLSSNTHDTRNIPNQESLNITERKETSSQQPYSNKSFNFRTTITSIIKGAINVLRYVYTCAFLIVICAMLYGCFHEITKNNSAVKQTAQTQKSAPPIEPIAKKNVVTGYDSSKPILNDDGLCELTIDNTQNNMPVYVRVWDMDVSVPIRAFYVDKGDTFTVYNLTPGVYEVRYIELYDNDFPATGSKSEQFEMKQIESSYGVQYSQMSLTLYKVRNGNTHTSSIPANQI